MSVGNVSKVSLIGEKASNGSIITIECSEQFTFVNVTELLKYTYIDCNLLVAQEIIYYNNYVGQFILDNCTFNGLERSGTALNIDTTNAHITTCSFTNTQGTNCTLYFQAVHYSISYQVTVGGAIISTNSRISVQNTVFEGNGAQRGGAIFVEQDSELILNESVFNRNSHSSQLGSVVYAENSSSVIILQSTFENTSLTSERVK